MVSIYPQWHFAPSAGTTYRTVPSRPILSQEGIVHFVDIDY